MWELFPLEIRINQDDQEECVDSDYAGNEHADTSYRNLEVESFRWTIACTFAVQGAPAFLRQTISAPNLSMQGVLCLPSFASCNLSLERNGCVKLQVLRLSCYCHG